MPPKHAKGDAARPPNSADPRSRLFAQILVESPEAPAPECVILRGPVMNALERRRSRNVDSRPAFGARDHEARLFENAQMLRDGRERYVELVHEAAHRSLFLEQ